MQQKMFYVQLPHLTNCCKLWRNLRLHSNMSRKNETKVVTTLVQLFLLSIQLPKNTLHPLCAWLTNYLLHWHQHHICCWIYKASLAAPLSCTYPIDKRPKLNLLELYIPDLPVITMHWMFWFYCFSSSSSSSHVSFLLRADHMFFLLLTS